MTATRKRRPAKLAQSSAYHRLAAKARRAGQWTQADHYTRIADRLYREYGAEREARQRRMAR